ncbi:MAG: PD40 domain-containing protein, partial [Bacteroidales bacterium]|nr:PD40 domain-containing protein [Bacteroidales bacterium]
MAFLLLVCVGNLSAQYAKLVDSKKYTKTEMSLFNASVDYFESADYTNAYMGFSQLRSWYASDPVFSYYCGASMVMLRIEYDKAIKYLLLAYDNKLYESDYYLGLAYHRKYLFSRAITYYTRYKDYLVETTKGKSPNIAEVAMLTEKASMARTLGQESYVLKVMTNSKVKRSNFHFSYGRKILDGNLVVKPDFFKMRNDKNNKDIDLVYVLDTIAFVSSYGNDMKTGLDLYFSTKTEEGWSPLRLLPGKVNTSSDEAFPFLSADGTLYFASKGHNSIGGYDIFKSEYDVVAGEWQEPVNLGFPINTPYDDFMYAIESNGNSAFFASDRTSKDGQVMVCRYIVEEEPTKVHIETEEHLAEQADLPVTPGAEAEYNRILQEQKEKENEQKDSTAVVVQEVKHELDTTDMFVSTKTMLDEKVDAISDFQDYSKKLNAYARITSAKIRNLRESGADNVSSSEITNMANSVIVYYDLAQKFNSVYNTAKPTLDYCTKEMEFLNKLETGSSEYQFKLQNLSVSVEKVNAKSPLDELIAEKKNEKKQAEDALKKFGKNMKKDQKTLSEINAKLETKMQQIQNETDPVMRERYVNEHKALENAKVDAVRSIKNMQIEAKRLNTMIARATESIKMLESIDNILENLDLSELDDTDDVDVNDILSLKNFVSEEDHKVNDEYEKMVEEDESMYSEKIDYDSIVANKHDDSGVSKKEVAVYKDYMSASTSNVVEKLAKRDSLNSEKSRLESLFDVAETDDEKVELLDRINDIQKQITEKDKEIESDLAYETNPEVSRAIDDYNSMRQVKVNSEDWPDLISSTQDLIEKSHKIESQIAESQNNTTTSPDKLKLLEKIKSDVDNQIVDKVDEMRGILVAQQSGKKDIAALNGEISKIRSSVNGKAAEGEVKKDVSSASKKVEEAKRGNSDSGATLSDAENILDGAVEKRIAILNDEYEAESRVYDVLLDKYVKSKSNEAKKQQSDVIYYSALEAKQQAESVDDEVEKMKYLSEAKAKMKSANSALLQVISPDAKPESQTNDVLTESILSLYNDIKEQKLVSGSNVVENTGEQVSTTSQLQSSVNKQAQYESNIATADSEISGIKNSLATADRSEKKRLQSELAEATTERNDNVRSLGEEKGRFYAEIDKSAREQITESGASTEYANKYADYRQSLYSLTNAEQTGENVSEKLTETEKSEYALLQTIIPNVDSETKSVLQPIYNKLDEKYGTGNVTIADNNAGKSTTSQLQSSVNKQSQYESNIATADSEISGIESSLATADRSEKKRLQGELAEATTERNDNVRSLGEEKGRFYAEIDKSAREQITESG